jgi:hypothetical protein
MDDANAPADEEYGDMNIAERPEEDDEELQLQLID